MGVAVLIAVWTSFSARHQSAQFLFVAVFRALNDLKKNIKPLYELENILRFFRGRKEHLNHI